MDIPRARCRPVTHHRARQATTAWEIAQIAANEHGDEAWWYNLPEPSPRPSSISREAPYTPRRQREGEEQRPTRNPWNSEWKALPPASHPKETDEPGEAARQGFRTTRPRPTARTIQPLCVPVADENKPPRAPPTFADNAELPAIHGDLPKGALLLCYSRSKQTWQEARFVCATNDVIFTVQLTSSDGRVRALMDVPRARCRIFDSGLVDQIVGLQEQRLIAERETQEWAYHSGREAQFTHPTISMGPPFTPRLDTERGLRDSWGHEEEGAKV